MSRFVVPLVMLAAVIAPAGVAAAPTIKLANVATGLNSPTDIANAGDGTNRLFITEKQGTIRYYHNGQLRPGYFLDIRSKVSTSGERGLLGLAFHPDYETNRRFFVYYTGTDGDVIIARYTANSAGTSASASTGQALMRIEHSAQTNHNGGGLRFGPQGLLYIAVGDGGGTGDPEGDARSVTRNYLGKILRINPDGLGAGAYDRYSNPLDNPYIGRSGLDEIWARGLRNPWRISFDRATGALWIADVGQSRREEINRQNVTASNRAGRDYGWNIMEGTSCYRPSACPLAGDTLPVAEYSHSNGNCSITGGYVYRGTKQTPLIGRYIFADYCSGRIWSLSTTTSGAKPSLGADTSLNITSFGEAESGEVYLVASNGKMYRVEA